MVEKRFSLTFSFIIFYLGALLGLSLTVIAAWADLEAATYGFDDTGGELLGTLRCPILMTADETSTVSVKVANTTKGKLSPTIKTDITSWLGPVTSYTPPIVLAPGESKQLKWKIGPENLELRRFIFARAWVYGIYPLPSRENTCGVLILNLPTNGRVITWTMTILSLLGIGFGLLGVMKFRGPVQSGMVDILRFKLIAVLAIIGLVTAFMGWWLLGIIVVVVSLLLLVVSVFTVGR